MPARSKWWDDDFGRECTGECGRYLAWENFSISKTGVHGRGHVCKECGKSYKESTIEVHHELNVKEFPEFECDLDNLWVLCEECHAELHSRDGCRYSDIAAKVCY